MEHASTITLLGFRRRTPKRNMLPHAVKQVCRGRALKRWSALLTQKRSRIGHNCGMRKRLGEANWKAFVQYAETRHKESFVRSFMPSDGMLCCVGKIDGTPCPRQVQINLRKNSSRQVAAHLPELHMDHTYEVKQICEVWSNALPENPTAWDEGICGPLLAHLLFGTEDHVLSENSDRTIWHKQINFRCGNVQGVEGQRAADFCHDVAGAHYDHVLRIGDIALPAEEHGNDMEGPTDESVAQWNGSMTELNDTFDETEESTQGSATEWEDEA